MTKRLGFLVVVACMLASVACSSASASSVLRWSRPRQIADAGLTGLACQGSRDCVAVTSTGRAYVTADPTAGRSTWHADEIDPGNRLLSLSCNISVCVAIDATAIIWSRDPSESGTWHRVVVGGPDSEDPNLLTHISCPSATLCVVGDDNGGVLSTRDPTGPADRWLSAQVDPNSAQDCISGACGAVITGIACPSDSFCMAVDTAGDAVVSSNPTGGNPAWRAEEIFDTGHVDDLTSVSCPTRLLCETTDASRAELLATREPATGPWLETLASDASAVFCPGVALCVETGSYAGPNLVSTEPSFGGWAQDGFSDEAPITGAASPAANTYLVVDSRGRVVRGTRTAARKAR